MHIRILRTPRLLLCLLAAGPARGQDTATLTGAVTDPSGAVLAGARVSVVNTATNLETLTETNAEGLYRAPFLRPGIYRVTISAAGFKRFVRDNVELRVDATVPINAVMEIGAVAVTVEVKAAVPLLATETSNTGTVLESDLFYRVPLYQRHVRSVLYLTPGIEVSGFGRGSELGGFQINGESSGRIGYFEDSMYGVRPSGGWTTDTIANTIDEIKVLTTALPAEYGHSAGGAILVATGYNGELHQSGQFRHLQPGQLDGGHHRQPRRPAAPEHHGFVSVAGAGYTRPPPLARVTRGPARAGRYAPLC